MNEIESIVFSPKLKSAAFSFHGLCTKLLRSCNYATLNITRREEIYYILIFLFWKAKIYANLLGVDGNEGELVMYAF